MPRQLRGSRTKAESSRDTKPFAATGIFGGPQVLFVHMKPTHEAQNPMVYGVHRRTPFMNNTTSQAYAVPECTATRRGTSGRTSSRCSTESARCVLLQQRMLQAPTNTNRQGCGRVDAGRDWFLRQAGWWRSWESQYRVSPRRGPITQLEAVRRLKPAASRLPVVVTGLLKTIG